MYARRMNDASPPADGERRAEPRSTVMLAATIERAGETTPVRLVNLSNKGSSIIGGLPSKHCSVTLHRNGRALRARVAWVEDGRGGLDFEDELERREMLRAISTARPTVNPAVGRPPLRAPTSRAERESIERCANLLGIRLPTPVL